MRRQSRDRNRNTEGSVYSRYGRGHPNETLELPISGQWRWKKQHLMTASYGGLGVLPREILKSGASEMPFPAF